MRPIQVEMSSAHRINQRYENTLDLHRRSGSTFRFSHHVHKIPMKITNLTLVPGENLSRFFFFNFHFSRETDQNFIADLFVSIWVENCVIQ